MQEGGQQGQVVHEQHVQHPLHQSLHHSDVNYSTTHQSFPYFLPTSAGLVKPDSHSISDDLKPSPDGPHHTSGAAAAHTRTPRRIPTR